MLARVIKIELDQAPDCEFRVEVIEIERTLAAAQSLVHALERSEVKAVLVAEVVIDHAFVGAGALRDRVHAAAEQALGGKLVLRCLEDGFTCAVRVTPIDAVMLAHAPVRSNVAASPQIDRVSGRSYRRGN